MSKKEFLSNLFNINCKKKKEIILLFSGLSDFAFISG
jgi:hypothetical protein